VLARHFNDVARSTCWTTYRLSSSMSSSAATTPLPGQRQRQVPGMDALRDLEIGSELTQGSAPETLANSTEFQ
jgi:hypothetical protein